MVFNPHGLDPFLDRAVQGRFQGSIKDLALDAVDEPPPAILFYPLVN